MSNTKDEILAFRWWKQDWHNGGGEGVEGGGEEGGAGRKGEGEEEQDEELDRMSNTKATSLEESYGSL